MSNEELVVRERNNVRAIGGGAAPSEVYETGDPSWDGPISPSEEVKRYAKLQEARLQKIKFGVGIIEANALLSDETIDGRTLEEDAIFRNSLAAAKLALDVEDATNNTAEIKTMLGESSPDKGTDADDGTDPWDADS